MLCLPHIWPSCSACSVGFTNKSEININQCKERQKGFLTPPSWSPSWRCCCTVCERVIRHIKSNRYIRNLVRQLYLSWIVIGCYAKMLSTVTTPDWFVISVNRLKSRPLVNNLFNNRGGAQGRWWKKTEANGRLEQQLLFSAQDRSLPWTHYSMSSVALLFFFFSK